jgi:signal transduction histidine kinase
VNRRTATAIAAAALVLVVALDAAGVALGFARGASIPQAPPVHAIDAINQGSFALLAVLGLVVAWYRPRNVVWFLATLTAFCSATSNFTFEYALLAKVRVHPSLPGWQVSMWLALWTWAPQVFTAPLVMLVYPNGRLISPRWRWLVALILVSAALMTAGFALAPAVLYGPGQIFFNPIGIPALRGAAFLANDFSFFGTAVFGLVGLVSLVVRYRRAAGDERQQIKWLGYAAGLYALQVLLTNVYYATGLHNLDSIATATNIASVVAFPIAVGIGMLRYRLFDIDLVINKTLVYGALAALITGFYIAVVVGLGSLVGARSNLLLAIVATAVIAMGFQPLRQRLQRLANRLVFGSRATPYEVLAQFSSQVADAYSGEDVLTRMARVLGEGTGAESAAVWLGDRPAAAWTAATNGHGGPGDERQVEVWDHGERLGALTVRMRRGQSLTQHEEKLLADLAGQAGLVLRNVGLNQQLLQRLEELRASRERLVRAQNEERRRLERDLHDGAQQHLVALKLRVGLLKEAATARPEQLSQLAADVESEADDALRTMRELARGIYPPLLADGGLRPALEAQARRATLPVKLQADGVGRYPPDVEAAVYFCVLEALQNVLKHAHATEVRVSLTQRDGRLEFEVEDDGGGFDAEAGGAGAGLANMRDRMEALGGQLTMRSAPGRGTTVRGSAEI